VIHKFLPKAQNLYNLQARYPLTTITDVAGDFPNSLSICNLRLSDRYWTVWNTWRCWCASRWSVLLISTCLQRLSSTVDLHCNDPFPICSKLAMNMLIPAHCKTFIVLKRKWSCSVHMSLAISNMTSTPPPSPFRKYERASISTDQHRYFSATGRVPCARLHAEEVKETRWR
jgi:hypothetical protein